MLKIVTKNIDIGTTFYIRNSWRGKIAKHLNKDEETLPFNFRVIEKVENDFLCETIPDKASKKKYNVLVNPTIIHYVKSQEVEDTNVGLYFSDYLPIENSKLLIYNNRNNKILPTEIKFSVTEKDSVPYIELILEDLLTNELFTITSQMRNSWKLLNGSDTYMTDIEKMYQDTFIHKGYVLSVCTKFSEYLKQQGLGEDAAELIQRASAHDNSKILNKDEFRTLTNIVNDKSSLTNANSQLSFFKQDSLELHWKHNSHHPEHFDNYDEMSKIDRLEMVCDWMARSLQYKSDLIDFVTTRQKERFRFSEEMYNEIYDYCITLVQLYQTV